MKQLISWIEKNYSIQAIPVRIKNEKRWEAMDEIIPSCQALEGIPQNLVLGDGFGVVLYSFDMLSEEIKSEIKVQYQEQK